MPSKRAISRAPASIPPALIRVVRIVGITGLTALALFCAILLAVRFVVFPRVEAYRDDLIAALSKQLGQPVEIDGLATGWDGWNPKLVIRGFRVRSGAGAVAAPLLDLPEVDLIVAWTSLPLLDLRLKRLVIERPRLAIRRDRGGMLHVAGMELDPGQMTDDRPLTDWLLRQPHIVVHDALVTWNDDLRNAPQLVLDQVQFRLDSRFGRHRFGLRGAPPPELAAPIDVRGDLAGASVNELQHANGKLYIRLDYADIAAWNEWLPLPVPIASGKGALRVWFDLADGGPKEIVADLELADVKAKLGAELAELDLAHLSGRAGWRAAPPRREFYGRQLAFVTTGGQRLDPSDFTLTLRDAAGGNAATGLLEFDRLELAPLRDLAVHLPIPERLRADLARYAPRGTLTHGRVLWEGPVDAPLVYNVAADFADLGVAAQGALPGAQGLAGRVEATQAAGDLKLASRGGALELPQGVAGSLLFDSLSGDVSWEHKPDRTDVRIERLEFANRDTAGRAVGTYRTTAKGPGEIELDAQLARADLAQLHRYLPLPENDAVRSWLRSALVKGTAGDVRLKLVGNLAGFPFANGKGRQFALTAQARNVVLDYARGWPPVSDLDAEVRIDGAKLTVDASRGRISGVLLGKVRAEIGDLAAVHPLLGIDGDASGATADFLRFIDSSPVAGWIDHLTDGAQATGDGRLGLKLSLSLGDPAATKVAGEYLFAGGEFRLVGAPALSQINGKLLFTEREVRARDLAAEVLGGPAKFAIASADDQVRVTGSGTASVAALRREYNPPFGEALSGNVDWTLAASLVGNVSAWTLESSLKGITVDLPAPLGKAPAEIVPLKVERRVNAAQPNEDMLSITYGQVGRLSLHRRLAAAGATVDRGLLLLGRAAETGAVERADRPGMWLRGELPLLNFDDWLALRRRGKSAGATTGELELEGVDLDVGVLEAFGRRFNDAKVGGRRSQDDWRLDLRARELAGVANWSAPTADAPNGRLAARLARLMSPNAAELTPWKGAAAEAAVKPEAGAGNPWPAIDIEADGYFVRGRDIGRLEFVAHPRGTDWRIDKLVLSNEGGRLAAEGQWQVAGKEQQTKLDVALDLTEAGKFLSRIGYADALRNGPTKVKGQLAWAGAPNDFDYPTLTGTFRIDVGPGRFTKIEPGIGKLLGVLSLQALPRRITLDFTDVFSEGFTFDDITGDVRVQNGVMKTDNLRLNGPAAKVDIAGEVDLARETQRLTVRVQPALSGSLSAGAALLFLANPIIGAAVGAGSLLAQKILRDPIEQMFSYEYQVTGSWSDPIVARQGTATAAALPGPQAK